MAASLRVATFYDLPGIVDELVNVVFDTVSDTADIQLANGASKR
jgi:hypothetical protein